MDGTVHTAAATTIIRFERDLNHRIGKVWAALTQPDQLQQWLASPAEIEPRVGGRVHLALGQLTIDSTITALDPPHLLEYGWHDRPNDEVKVRWELAPQVAAPGRVGPGSRLSATSRAAYGRTPAAAGRQQV
jgi:uncharacterized protein YndB with AHSA1/START domain